MGLGSSAHPNGERKSWELIWKANVPPKVRVFAWKLATKGLAVQNNRCKRIKNTVETCNICGTEAETEYHAVMSCPKARALRLAMREFWQLPKEEELFYTGHDWVLNILANHEEDTRSQLLFIWWRAWHLRNNSIFGDGKDKISTSACFLKNYFNTTAQIKNGDAFCDRKGKCKVDKQIPKESKPMKELCKASWCKPQPGWMKINTDASFLAETGATHWGAIVRDHEGKTILSAWSPIDRCNNAAEAEVEAASEVLCIAACLNMPSVLESDCQYVVDCLSNHVLDRSQACFIVDEAITVADTIPSLKVVKVHRDGNLAAHKLAAYSRSVLSSGVLHYSVPTCIREQVMHECNLNEFE
jgi:ribonuclease HI